MQFFEVLAACYETLMHSEFRRKCDVLLREMEKKQNSKTSHQMTKSSYNTKSLFSDGMILKQRQLQAEAQSRPVNTHSHALVIKGVDSIPGLIPSTSESSSASGEGKARPSPANSGESNDTVLRNNCTSLGGILNCAAGPIVLEASPSSNNSFTISRDGTKGFKSLVDSSSLSASQSQGSLEEEAEMHFSEATVNRLFGGPMASLHRARNFQAFSDPYLVFDKVFGNQRPMFPRVTIADINTVTEETAEDVESGVENGHNLNLIRSSTSLFSHTELEPFSTSKKNQNKNKDGSISDKNANDMTANTKVFVSSRVFNGRKITKTETVHIDPSTGIASVNVTVDGEDLEPVKSKKKSPHAYGTSVIDWLLCFGTAKVRPTTTKSKATSAMNLSSPKSSTFCPENQAEYSSEDQISSSCHGFKSLYVEALEDFYLCNDKFHEECNKYMRCGVRF